MEDRRKHYRHLFPAAERPSVRLDQVNQRSSFQAELLDLSLEGMRLRLEGRSSPLRLDERVVAHLELPRLATPLTLTCSVVYLERLGEVLDCGLHFLPLLVPAAQKERERILGKFLLEEQRRGRKKPRNSGTRLKLFIGE